MDIAHKLKPLWTSRMPRATKVGVLTAAVESVLMYGSESWTLTETLTKRLDGLYTRLLRFALNVSWKDKWTYGPTLDYIKAFPSDLIS